MLGIQKPISKAMQEGIDYEDEVRDLCSERFEMHFEPIVALADDRNWQLASLDGWNPETRTILEIKIVGENTFRRAVAGEYIECYAWQVQHQWAVFDANAAWLVFAKKEKESFKLFPIEQLKSERMIERLIREEEFFYKENILRFKEPDFKL